MKCDINNYFIISFALVGYHLIFNARSWNNYLHTGYNLFILIFLQTVLWCLPLAFAPSLLSWFCSFNWSYVEIMTSHPVNFFSVLKALWSLLRRHEVSTWWSMRHLCFSGISLFYIRQICQKLSPTVDKFWRSQIYMAGRLGEWTKQSL